MSFVLPVRESAGTAEALARTVRGMEFDPDRAGIPPLALACTADAPAQALRHEIAGVRLVPAGTATSCPHALCLADSFEELAAAVLLDGRGLRPRRGGWLAPSAAEVQDCAAQALALQEQRRPS